MITVKTFYEFTWEAAEKKCKLSWFLEIWANFLKDRETERWNSGWWELRRDEKETRCVPKFYVFVSFSSNALVCWYYVSFGYG